MFDLRFARYGTGEITQEPDEERRHENQPSHLAQVLRTLVPHVRQRGAHRRHTIGGQLHDERRLVDLVEEPPHQPRRDHRQRDTQQV